MGKLLFILAVMLAATVSFADGLCVQLCIDCSLNPENETCTKVNQVCGNCPAILDSLKQDSLAVVARVDSIEQEKARKDSLQSVDVRKLADIMQKNCKNDTCTFEVTIDKGLLGHIRAKKGNKATVTKEPEQTPQESLSPPISEECKNFCGLCDSEDQGESSSTCKKVEVQCKCSAYAEQERMLAEKAEADSIAAVVKFLNQMQTVQASANSVFGFCSKKAQAEPCSVLVKIKSEDMSLIELEDLSPKPVAEQDSIVNEAPKDSVIVAVAPAKDSVAKDSSAKLKKHANPYIGLSIAFEEYIEKEVANYDVYPDKQWGLNVGFLARWYFYNWGSFQTGANIVYHHAEQDFDDHDISVYGEGGINYQNIMLEIPLQFRFGFPLNKAGTISPFISASFHVRKPIYIWAEYNVGWKWSGSYWVDDYSLDETYDGFYASSDWEFLTYVGFGIEFNRNFSIQWQFLPISIVTYTEPINNYKCDDYNYSCDDLDYITWRINMDIAW